MQVLVTHLHGGWASAFLRGPHEYLIPVTAESRLPELPPGARKVPVDEIRHLDIDVAIVQGAGELELMEEWTGRKLGRELPAVFVEHNTPKKHPVTERHPLADSTEIPIVHVTHFNRLMWDCGDARTRVIEHGIPDPGLQYTGELAALGVVINEPVRRWRVTGTDLLPGFADVAPLHGFGIDMHLLPDALELPDGQFEVVGDLPTASLHRELARLRVYLHPFRWTSLGLSLLEAMSLGMPVLALDTTEAARAVPPEAGAISGDPAELRRAARHLMEDPDEARRRGHVAREYAQHRYGLGRFLAEWNEVLEDCVAGHHQRRRHRVEAPRPTAPGTEPAYRSHLEGAVR